MKRAITAIILLCTLAAGVISCSGDTDETTSTNFGQMLGDIPASFLDSMDVFFADTALARELYAAPEIENQEALKKLPDEQKELFLSAFNETSSVRPDWQQYDLWNTIGFDIVTPDRLLICGSVPPKISTVMEGDFNTETIREKITALGYGEITRGNGLYYSARDDYQIAITDPLGRMVMASMNDMLVENNFVMVSPAKEFVTGVMDTRDGELDSAEDIPAVQALTDSLGDVLVGSITVPERLIINPGTSGSTAIFNQAIAEDWGTLHDYEMAALGYRAEGDERYFDIALYYTDSAAAEADGKEIVKRMQSYSLNSFATDASIATPFTNRYEPGEPELKHYENGTVLIISCRVTDDQTGISVTLIGGSSAPFRDLLFLAPVPQQYIAE